MAPKDRAAGQGKALDTDVREALCPKGYAQAQDPVVSTEQSTLPGLEDPPWALLSDNYSDEGFASSLVGSADPLNDPF
jgi:hypothetical protein